MSQQAPRLISRELHLRNYGERVELGAELEDLIGTVTEIVSCSVQNSGIGGALQAVLVE